MTRPLAAAAVALSVLTAMAITAPVPPRDEVSRIAAAYGTWYDLDKDCKHSFPGGKLTVSLPAGEHQLCRFPSTVTDNAPRVLREVEGDFTAVAHVVIPIPKDPGHRRVAGGLLAWHSFNEFLTIRVAGGSIDGAREGIWGYHAQPSGSGPSYVNLGEPTGSGFVRIQRLGNKVIDAWSRDGKVWTGHQREVAWVAKVKVGVVAESDLGVPVDVVFDLYRLTRVAK